MRKYHRVWEALKKNKKVSLSAPINSHARIINAVHKEKCNDIGWRLLVSEDSKRFRMKEKVDKEVITFYLKEVYYIDITKL